MPRVVVQRRPAPPAPEDPHRQPDPARETVADPARPAVHGAERSRTPELSAATLRAARQAWADELWGVGLCLPGGDAELLRLAGLLPLGPSTTLLLVGDGAAASAAELGRVRGTYVSAHDLDEARSARAQPLMRKLKGRITVETWAPGAPVFRPNYHHHALLLEPGRNGAAPARMLGSVARALRAGGQVVLLDLILSSDAAAEDPVLRRWRQVEGRPRLPPPGTAIVSGLQNAGFSIHVTEDCGARQAEAITAAWAGLVRGLSVAESRPAPGAAAALVAEAEACLLRTRLLRSGTLRLLRWHATKS